VIDHTGDVDDSELSDSMLGGRGAPAARSRGSRVSGLGRLRMVREARLSGR
jgi:hypothetical protein